MADSLYVPSAALVATIQVALGAFTAGLALRVARARPAVLPDAAASRLPLLGGVLAALVLVSWPLLHLLVESLVPLWPEAMCAQGVRRVGEGSPGAAGALPTLLAATTAMKPAVLGLAVVWVAVHLCDRETRTGPLARRAAAVLAVLGGVAATDAAVELSWLAIEKRDVALVGGCCTLSVADLSPRALGLGAAVPAGDPRGLAVAHFALTACLAAGAAAWAGLPLAGRGGVVPAPRFAPALLVLAAVAVPVAVAFQSDVLAPALLDRPLHRCASCLFAEAPESIVGAGLWLLGPAALGTAGTLAYAARGTEAAPSAARRARSALVVASFGWTAAAVFAASGLVLA